MKKIIFTSLLLITTGANAQYISGLSPVDLTSNLEQYGFVTESFTDSVQGIYWTSTRSSEGLDYRVEAISDKESKLKSIHASVSNIENNSAAALTFIKNLSSIIFSENLRERNQVEKWIEYNYSRTAVTLWMNKKIRIASPSPSVKEILFETY